MESAKSKTITSLKSSSLVRPLSAKFLIEALGSEKSERLENTNGRIELLIRK